MQAAEFEQANYLLSVARRFGTQYDVIITADNESDFGGRGIQYIHFPKFDPVRPAVDLRWYNRSRRVADLYRRLATRLTGFSMERMRHNLSVVNSEFMGARVRALHGVETVTVHPPIAGSFPAMPWERREDGFVCIGRISPEKRFEQIIGILATVRGKDLAPHLQIVGTPDSGAYAAFIRTCVDANRSWVTMHENLPRQELAQLVSSHRYGIHAMHEEPFGMAVAEMVSAGCIGFAPNNGGSAQILGGDERLLYSSPQDAAEKIELTIVRPDLQKDLREYLTPRRALFSAQRFVNQITELVKTFEPG